MPDEPLQYADRSTRRDKLPPRRLAVRILSWLLVLGLAGLILYPFARDYEMPFNKQWRAYKAKRRQARDLAQQKQAMELARQRQLRFTRPADDPAYHEGPPLDDDEMDQIGRVEHAGNVRLASVRLPETAAALVPDSSGLVFLHGRRSPSGRERLVAVTLRVQFLGAFRTTSTRSLTLVSAVEPPPTSPVVESRENSISQVFKPQDEVRVLFGQPDPGDPSGILIPIIINGQRELIRGQLLDDDTVRFTRSPATLPAKSSPPGVPQ